MEKFVTDFVIDYMKRHTNSRKPITNQKLDLLLQTELGCTQFHESGIRALIHYIRLHVDIVNENQEKGWICGVSDGYYLSYNAVHILTHLQAFEGKIRKMMLVHERGMSLLVNKLYYKQAEFDFKD